MFSLYLILEIVGIGIGAGLIYGIFGGGSGLVMTPAFYYLLVHLPWIEGHGNEMQIAIASCAAASAMIGSVATVAQARLNSIDWMVIKRCWFGVLIGTSFAVFLLNKVPSHFLKNLFGVVLIPVAIWMWFFRLTEGSHIWSLKSFWHHLRCVVIGWIWFMLGIAVFTVPYLHKCGIDMRRAIGCGAAMSAIFSAIATVFFIVSGLNKIPLSLTQWGYVNAPLFLISGIVSMVAGYVGVHISHTLPKNILKKLYALLILISALLMLQV